MAGVSPSAASLALRNKPGVSAATRERVLRIAKESGYVPDPRIESWMARVRDTKSKDLLPIAWLNTSSERDAWHRYPFQSPYVEGASKRALELGYRLEELWCHEPGMTMKRLSKILYQRGIEGVVAPFPARHFRLDWDHLSSVALGETLMAPRLHRITGDVNYNLQLALKMLKRLGYRRIGICLARTVDTASHASAWDTARALYSSASKKDQVPPLFYPLWHKGGGSAQEKERATTAWIKQYKPEVIVGHDNRLVKWAEDAGFRVPEDMGVVHLAVDDDVLDWAGIHSNRRKMGETAIEWLVSLIRNRQFGAPEMPLNILIRGAWQTGRTIKTLPETKAKGPAPGGC